MKITYEDMGRKQELEYHPELGTWTGTEFETVEVLNISVSGFLNRQDYYPTNWHMVKAVADRVEGKLDEPEPKLPPPVKGVEY